MVDLTKYNIDEALLAKHFAGETNQQEEVLIQEWLQEQPNQNLYNTSWLTWVETSRAQNKPVLVNEKQAWTEIQNNIQSDEKAHVFRLNRHWLKAVAAVFVVCLVGSLLLFNTTSGERLMMTELSTKSNELTTTLSDGTTVQMNQSSKFWYDPDFDGSTRSVQLEGEAFFDVAHAPEQPFTITTKHLNVTVLGTSFNVFAPQDAALAEVAVKTGKVLVEANGQSIYLTAGERVVYDHATRSFTVKQADLGNSLAWLNKQLRFNNNDLNSVVQDLNRYYNTNLLVDANIKNCKFTGKFESAQFNTVLKTIQLALDVDVQYFADNDKIQLKGEGCN